VLGVTFQQPAVSDGLFVNGLPTCESAYASREAMRVFDTMPLMKLAGITAVRLDDGQEFQDPVSPGRSCVGKMLASNTMTHRVTYSFESRNNHIYVRIKLVD
jgi:hypothetical protein